jgi:hypothetical protein
VTVLPRSRVGKTTLWFWKCGIANEEVQRLGIEASKNLELNDIPPAASAFTIGDE